ncbi:MAG: hypothetical protein WAO95_04020 [Burkholderiales bacterium]
MKILRIALALLLGALSVTAVAQRALVPIVDYKDVTVATRSGKPVTGEQVRDAIAAAGKRLSWDMAFAANSGLVGTLVVNNKHTVSVDINVAADKFSVKYRNSINMKYGLSGKPHYANSANLVPEGVPVIHPAYNQWVQALMTAIDSELKKL